MALSRRESKQLTFKGTPLVVGMLLLLVACAPGAPPPPQSGVLPFQFGEEPVPLQVSRTRPTKPVTLTIVPEESESRYRVREQLVTLSLPSDAVGSTKDITGSIALGSDGAVNREQSKVVVEVRNLKSDRVQRDRYLQREILETQRFPEVSFVPTELRGLQGGVPRSGELQVEMAGDLTVRDVTRQVTWQGTAHFSDSDIVLNATLVTTFAQLGLTKPSVAVLLSVEDKVQLEADLRLLRVDEPEEGAQVRRP